jgi:hypothetical protein
MISSTSYATKWYITLFANTFPFQTQLRMWDAFFLEGRDVIVITAVAIIWVLKGKQDLGFTLVCAWRANFFSFHCHGVASCPTMVPSYSFF